MMIAIMPDQWKSITGLAELEQPASAEAPKPSTEKSANPSNSSNAVSVEGFLFTGGLLFGIGAALLVFVVTLFFDLITAFGLICYLTPATGWLIGKAVRKGSQGAGGLPYQVASIFLTYTATALATAPYYFYFAEQKYAQQSNQWLAGDWDVLYAKCALSGFFSPFLSLQRGAIDVIGAIFLGAGLYIAYRITDRERPNR